MNKFLKLMKMAFAVMALACLCLALFVACEPKDERETFTVSIATYNTVLGTLSLDKESYKDGDTVVVTVAPKQGQELRRLVVGEQEVTEQCTFSDGVYTYTFTIKADVKIEVAFKSIDKWCLTVEDYNVIAGTVTLSPENQEEYLKGELVTVSVEANEGYEISSVTLNGEEITLVEGSYSFNIMSDSTLAVEFEPTVTYTVTVNGLTEDQTEYASVQFSPNKPNYGTNEPVTLTVSVMQGYILTSVTVNEQDVTESFNSRGGAYVLTVTQNMTVDFTFDEEDLSIIEQVTSADFDMHINRNGKVLAYFSADWCSACAPTYENLQEVAQMGLDLKIIKVDYGAVPPDNKTFTDDQMLFYKYSQQYASGSILPFFMLFEDGQPVAGMDSNILISVNTILNLVNNPSDYIK